MVHLRKVDGPWDQLDRLFIGFEHDFNKLMGNTGPMNFPPYNIIKVDDDNFLIEMALAGYSKEDITIEHHKSSLTIRGHASSLEDETFLHRGVAKRKFTKTFTLDKYIVVRWAHMDNGMLIIDLARELPEEAKPRIIDIE